MSEASLNLRQKLTRVAHRWKAVTRQHHRELLPILAPLIAPDAIIIDVGAHAGQFTKLFAGLARDGHVYAFEPGSYARSILLPVLRTRRLSNVTLLPLGLSDSAGEAVLSTPVKASGSLGFGVATLGHSGDGRAQKRETVRLVTLDSFVAEHAVPRLDFIKIDVEGWEGAVIRGAAHTLARLRPALMLELVQMHLARAGDDAASLFATLSALGYRAARIEGDAAHPHVTPHDSFAGDGDYLFTQKERAP